MSFLVDLHVHTCVSSPCSLIDPGRMIEKAAAAGLDAVCVTEHDEIEGAQVAARMGRQSGYRVFKGIEVYTEMGDMLVFGLYRNAPGWKVPFDELLAMCDEVGAVVIPAHPCRVSGELEKLHGKEKVDFMLDKVTALETHNGGCPREGNEEAFRLARSSGLPGVGGSDSHHEFQVGRCLTIFDDELTSDEELVQALKAGGYRGAYMGEPV